jgi:aryl-alcohol dehydrogenase-like predicted oxidoreductase
MEERGCRDEMVVATKFTTGYKANLGTKIIQSNFGGNNAKGMKHSVDASLQKLKTDYIDLLWVHWWDYSTSIEEVMYSLNELVVSGKVIYLGISDTPAWIVSKANEFARAHHLRPFVVYQGRWSAADRDFERDIIPMCKMENMGLCPWGSLGGGNFKTQAQREAGEGRKMIAPSDKQLKLSEVLEGIGKRKQVPLTSKLPILQEPFNCLSCLSLPLKYSMREVSGGRSPERQNGVLSRRCHHQTGALRLPHPLPYWGCNSGGT